MTTTTTFATTISNDNTKRQRTEDPTTKTPSPTNPFVATKQQLEIVLPSLPTQLQTFVSKHTIDFISNLNQCSMKTSSILRLEDTTVIPRSTKTNFELTVKNDVRESDEIKTIIDQVEQLKLQFSMDLKNNIIAAAKIERDTIFNKGITNLVTCCIGIAKFYLAYHLDDTTITDGPPNIEHILDDILPRIDKIKDDFDIITCDSRVICRTLLKTNEYPELSHMTKGKLKPIKDALNKQYTNIFEVLINLYNKTTTERNNILKATKALKQFETDLLAEDVIEKIEIEKSVNPTELRILVKEEIRAELSLKNTRGAQRAASTKKKETTTKKTTTKKTSKTKSIKAKNKKEAQEGKPNDTKKQLKKTWNKNANKKQKDKKTSSKN